MKVENLSIDALKPYPTNPRRNDSAVDAVAKSIDAFGWNVPVICDKDLTVIAGHTRIKAAKQLGMDTIPVYIAEHLTPDQVKAYRLADNRTGEIANWDFQLLPEELRQLQMTDIDLGLLGFTERDLQIMLGGVEEGYTDPDAVPDLLGESTTQQGDLWKLGEHRLLCGDSGNAEDVEALLGGETIQLVNTDPPYNVNVKSVKGLRAVYGSGRSANNMKGNIRYSGVTQAKQRRLAGDGRTDEQYIESLNQWFGNIGRVLEPGRAFYIWGGYVNCGYYPPILKVAGLYFSQAIIWVKEWPVFAHKDYMIDHEWCFYGWREGAAHVFLGPQNATDIWHVKKLHSSVVKHLTEKPVELALRAIQYSSRPQESVLDLFGGSGSTLIAAQQTGRRAYIMEIDPFYCDIIVRRWEQFTGGKAVMEGGIGCRS